jgi:signal transduction histidine kinase
MPRFEREVSHPLRFVRAAAVISFALGAIGAGWELARFGPNDQSALARLEREVRDEIDERAARIQTLAGRIAANPDRIVGAIASRDALPSLFNDLNAFVQPREREPATVTIYVPDRPGTYKVLAWSDGPGGSVANDLLKGPGTLFVARGTAGLRLAFVQPVELDGRRIAVAVAETSLAPVSQTGASHFSTSFGLVEIVPPPEAGASSLSPADGFLIQSPTGARAALLEVRYLAADPAERRREFRRRLVGLALSPLAVSLLFGVGPVLDLRRRASTVSGWLMWSAVAVLMIGAAATGLSLLAAVAGLPRALASTLPIAGAAAAAAVVPGGWWWRPGRRRFPAGQPLRFAIEQSVAGLVLAATVLTTATLMARRITPASVASWRSALFPLDFSGLLAIWSLLILVLAVAWAMAAVFGALAVRWRLRPGGRALPAAVVLWLLPVAILLLAAGRWLSPPGLPSAVLAAAFAGFAVISTHVRRYYRRTTQSMRLLLGFAAILAPLVAVYPMAAVLVDRATRTIVEQQFAPETAGQTDEIRDVLLETQDQIDAMSSLAAQVVTRSGQPVDSQTAFHVWTQTSLSRTRLISDIELYGPDRAIISRFTLNFPDYLYRASARTWQGSGCRWEVSGDVTRFGASDRAMLHAQRGLCDASGQLAGAVVLHVAPTDYRALPFLASANPYGAVLGTEPATRGPSLPGLEVVVYGWSLHPLFMSGRVAWSLDVPLFTRLYREGTPFWTTLEAEDRTYHVHFLQNRAGIYALGYPAPTAFEHAARLAEITAVTAVLFVLIQLAAIAYAPPARRSDAPLRVLLHEIRTSFYRKLFLSFVLVAIGPVFLFTLAFGAYMDAKFRADVEAEAENVVTAARRVFEQVAAAEEPPGQRLVPLTDDLMVWIRELIAQDVNLFDGSELLATSQRDLYNSGLLPTRTPAALYRRIALERLPTFVAEDGQYLVAGSPLPARGPDAVLSVPLASRQRAIEAEIDDLNRGVLVGSVLVVLSAAGLGAWLASRVADPVARLTAATRRIAAGRLDVRIAADTADELRRLVDDFNTMTATLVAQRAELARTNQLKAWNEMARQVAHEIKNPLTPIQLAAEHLERVHQDRGHPLGAVFDQCVRTILGQVGLLRRIASDFANFSAEPKPRLEVVPIARAVEDVVGPYRPGLAGTVALEITASPEVSAIADPTLLRRALANVVENAIQAMPLGGRLTITAHARDTAVEVAIADTGIGMDAEASARAFEPYFSTKTRGSGLGLSNAKRNLELQGGTIALTSVPGHGTTVTVRLPAAPRDEPAAGQGPSR